MLAARRVLRDVRHERGRTSLVELLRASRHAWHGVNLGQPDWSTGSHSLALGAELTGEGLYFHLILNAYWEALEFELPPLQTGGPWRRWIDTALAPPREIVAWQEAEAFSRPTYRTGPRSVVMMIAGPGLGPSLE
jgi:glycogen operon protein